MDKLIHKSKFENNTNEEIETYFSEINSIDIDNVNEDYVINIINALRIQIPKYNPQFETKESFMIIRCIVLIKDMTEGKMTENIEKELINLIKLIIESGWTATNCKMLEIITSKLWSDGYFENLKETKVATHFFIFENINLTISKTESKDNHELVRNEQQKILLILFVDYIKAEVVNENLAVFQTYMRSLCNKSWVKVKEEADIYSTIFYKSLNLFDGIFKTNVENFSKIFCEISNKIIEEPIQTEGGKDIITRFYGHFYYMLRFSKESIEILMDKFVKAVLDFYKLKQSWLDPIIETLTREISYTEKKYQATAFKKSEGLVTEATIFLTNVLDNYPTKPDEEDNENHDKYEKSLSNWIISVKSMTNIFLQFTMKTPEHFEAYIPCLVKMIQLNNEESSDIFEHCCQSIEKSMQELFKNKPELFNSLVSQCVETALQAGKLEDTTIPFPFEIHTFRYQNFYERIIKFGTLSKVFNSNVVQDNFRKNLLKCFSNYCLTISIFLSSFQSKIIFKDYTATEMLEFVKEIHMMLNNPLFSIYNPMTNSVGVMLGSISEQISQSGDTYSSSILELISICKTCNKNGLQCENYEGLESFSNFSLIIVYIFQHLLVTKQNAAFTSELYSVLLEVIESSDESHDYYSSWVSYAAAVPRQCSTPEILVANMTNMISLAKKLNGTHLEGNLYMILDGINLIITAKPEAALLHMDKIETLLSQINNSTYKLPILLILTLIYGEYPKTVNKEIIMLLAKTINVDPIISYHIAALFNTVSQTHSELIKAHLNKIVEAVEASKMILITPFVGIVTHILENDPKSGEEIFPIISGFIENNKSDTNFCLILFNGLRTIGLLRHDLLVQLKETIEIWQKSNTVYYDSCQHLLDVIADRSLTNLDGNIVQQGKKIGKLDTKVNKQEVEVIKISKDVKQNTDKIEVINKRVEDTEIRVDGIESEVKVIVEQVQEIDLKTVSNAPKWAREVSKLLNPESNGDWKLLASRLGYSSDDIKAWLTHADPCMSLLSDWFAIRRKVEATRAVLEQLVEMNRNDAAKIVEDALIVAESMVSDDDPIEFITPPSVFLSYQWGVQEEVKILREHLQNAGYRCWMDIGQMGGGDKLYEAIDRGIRGATVFISCVTKKYSESANCKRELNLAISLQKSVIPLQMERMEWPPVGTMGPLLTEYIFIRMFAKPGVTLVSGTFWPKDRFQELLMQIRYSCAPEYETVDPSYANWWQPPEIKSQYKPKEDKINLDDISQSIKDDSSNLTSPQIFISYQWGKQEEIKKLYTILTGMGYSCWMDIFQMGGGDSLYDKIDRGLRGCKVMISCVTSKYADSPNCRREISLCDSLKKPIIPIMLERLTWPPQGPMSLVLTQLIYISFVDSPEEQQTWSGLSTKELIDRISKHVSKSADGKEDVKIESQANEHIETKRQLKEDVKIESQPTVDVITQSESSPIVARLITRDAKKPFQKNESERLPIATSKSCIII